MELKFQTSNKQRSSSRGANKNKFVGVRQRPSGKWVAEIKNTTQKIRMWLGTFDTAKEAAQAYDEAAFLLRGSNTRTNFFNSVPCNPALSLKIRNLLNQKRSLNKPSPPPPPSTPPSSTTRNCSNQETAAKVASPINNFQSSCNDSFVSDQGSTLNLANSEELYKPDLTFSAPPHPSSCYDLPCAYTVDLDKIGLSHDGFYVPKRGDDAMNEVQFPDFERMKVERQISASLYAINGINEYWESTGYDSNDPFWDFPHLSQMFCPS